MPRRNLFITALIVVLLLVLVIFLPLDKVNWGRISILPAATITVTGTAQANVANQKATYNATVMSTNSDKQAAIDKVNTQMKTLVDSVKNFGIADADITTSQVSVYQIPPSRGGPIPMMYQGAGSGGANGTSSIVVPPTEPQTVNSGDWQASNSITITLRDVKRASELSDLLNKSGATNVYGPNLTVNDDTSKVDADLLAKAVADAKSKAQAIAKAGGQSIGKMINVQESGSAYPMPMYATKDAIGLGGGPSTPVEPGSSTMVKSVTVVFELK